MKDFYGQKIWNDLLSISFQLREGSEKCLSLSELIEQLETIEEILKKKCEPEEEFELYVFNHFVQSLCLQLKSY